eukprot:PLAT10730.1.p1 GENE.PLAT10730.1~~PLAT10730.1.p1  ORF type:complete len:587 (-),score=363.97 PLAT10730.1:133-1893(-)
MSRDRHSIAADFSQLQREYKHMEQNRRQYTEDIERTIKRQQAAIEKLRRDNEALKAEIAMESRFTAKPPSAKHATTIADLHEKAAGYQQKLDVEKRTLSELGKQIRLMKEKILAQRKAMGGINASKENHAMVQKQIRILENRLDKALVKYNEALASNKHLREQIDALRRDRVVFDGIYKKLERELHEKKRDMAAVIEESNEAYKARDRAHAEMAALKMQADKEQAEFEAEWKELGKMIEADRRMKDMLKTASSAGELVLDGDADSMSAEEEAELKQKVARGAWGIAKDKAQIQLSQEKVQSYEEAFAKIQEVTGISDVDELVDKFIEAEDKNFSLFNYVNQLNEEIEKLEGSIHGVKAEIEKYRGEGISTDNQRKKILKDLEAKLSRTEAKAEEYDFKYSASMKTVSQLKAGIHTIFYKIGCDASAVEEMFGDHGVTESNMMQYLGIIEQRTNELLQMYVASQHGLATVDGILPVAASSPAPAGGSGGGGSGSAGGDGGAAGGAAGSGGSGSPTRALDLGSRAPLEVRPPDWDDISSDDSDGDEEGERPLTREELTARTLKGLRRRQELHRMREHLRAKKAAGLTG